LRASLKRAAAMVRWSASVMLTPGLAVAGSSQPFSSW
jgi:hypothetical protein